MTLIASSAASVRSARDAYRRDAVQTATPAQRLVMLFDRLVLDLRRAQEALEGGVLRAAPHISHAQEILVELMSSLRTDAWDGAEQLLGLYAWANARLTDVRLSGDAAGIAPVIELVEPLRDAWRDAAAHV